ncbi:ABC transporter permease [Shewanella sp. NIFS-20-20]|uniref:ABC transporter permease n=1 Tax=Shewanella sp. NIFS-20-20 TaxID=2853806 RepID=UPI001C45285B|nr:ABC transporter permease [Shewanella sp. NIFS-20-20]MBV7315306.1 ABC transporter permease [Shewanella sp. NIFS-20-20]
MLKAISWSARFRHEVCHLWRSPWQLALATWVPLLALLFLYGIFSAAVPRNLPVALVDQDDSGLSRQLARQMQASPAVSLQQFNQLPNAEQAMREGDVFALILIPHGFSRELMTQQQPQLVLHYNGQFLLVGKLLSSALQQGLADALQGVARQQLLAKGVLPIATAANINPIAVQLTPLFNQSSNYLAFLMPPILIALLQISAMLLFANALNEELTPEFTTWVQQAFWPSVSAKMALYLPLALLQGLAMLVFMYHGLGLPLAGDILTLVPALIVMLLFIGLWVLVIFLLLAEPARVVSFCTALFAPAFAFMGITFPVHEMPLAAQWWRLLIPSSHYIDAQVAVVSYGQGLKTVLSQQLSYAVLLVLVPLLFLLLRRRRRPGE